MVSVGFDEPLIVIISCNSSLILLSLPYVLKLFSLNLKSFLGEILITVVALLRFPPTSLDISYSSCIPLTLSPVIFNGMVT